MPVNFNSFLFSVCSRFSKYSFLSNLFLWLVSALSKIENDVDARIILSSLLLEEGKDQETINLLSPPKVSGKCMIILSSGYYMVVQISSFFNCFYILYYSSAQLPNLNSAQTNPWWKNGKIKMQLAKIYHSKGKLEDFVDTIYSYVRETLVIEIMNRKVLF